MNLIRYGDIYKTIEHDDGSLEDVLILSNFTMPIIIDRYKIDTIEPYIGLNCKVFKNVSIITCNSGKQFKVVGNYKEIDNYKNNVYKNKKIGYGREA